MDWCSLVVCLFCSQVTYGILMYVEFGMGEWIDQWVFLYALSHQVRVLYCSVVGGGCIQYYVYYIIIHVHVGVCTVRECCTCIYIR